VSQRSRKKKPHVPAAASSGSPPRVPRDGWTHRVFLEKVVELEPKPYDSLFNLATAMADNSPEEAIPYLERFVREAPPEQYRDVIAEASELIRRIQSR
jgi:hypothetical protein